MMIRPYNQNDKTELIKLFRMNVPLFFDTSEEKDFIGYLEDRMEDYFVVEENDKIIGAGGINYFPEAGQARISWDMIHPDFQGKGIGKELTRFRISHIKKNPAIRTIIVRTSQHAYKFYEKSGFQLVKKERDFWAKEFDLYQMEMKIG